MKIVLLALLMLVIGIVMTNLFPARPLHGTVLEKMHFPAHVEHKFDVINGEYLCSEEPSNKVYLIEVRYVKVNDQWILKVSVNTNGVKKEVFASCDFNTWRYSNSVGKPLSGMINTTPVCW